MKLTFVILKYDEIGIEIMISLFHRQAYRSISLAPAAMITPMRE